MSKPLPPPLPPAERTVGQVIAESIRLYGNRFWAALLLGLPIAAITQLSAGHSLAAQTLILWIASPFVTAAYVWAIVIAAPARPPRGARSSARTSSGSSSSCPCPRCSGSIVLPALAWLALFGLSVPAAAYERLGFRSALVRGRRLAAADYVHALGSLCAVSIVYFITRVMLAASVAWSGGRRGARRGVPRRPRHLAAVVPRRRARSTSIRPLAS